MKRTLLKPRKPTAGNSGVEAVCLAGNRIGFVDKHWQAPQAAGQDGRDGGETAHAQNGCRLEVGKQAAAVQNSPRETGEKLDGLEGDSARQPYSRETGDSKFGAPLGRHSVYVFFGSEQQHLVPPAVEHFRDGQPRKEMSTCPACSDGKALHIKA